MKRPLLIAVLVYVAGILLGKYFPAPWPWLLSISLGLVVVALSWSRARLFFLVPLLVLTGWTNFALHSATISPNDLRILTGDRIELVTVRGVLRETPSQRVYERDAEQKTRTMAQIDVTELRVNKQNWRTAFGRVAVSTSEILPANFFGGQIVEVTGILRKPRNALADGLFDYRAYLAELGIYYQLQSSSARDWQIMSSPDKPPLADRFRSWARKSLALGLPQEDESLRLEWALALGWKTALTDDVSEPFVRAATYHIFAVDGLRMAIIFGIFFALFRAVTLPRAVCGLVLIPLIWFYAALTGWPASAIRATVMLTIIIVGWILKRPSDLINSLFVAAFIILIWQPQQLFQAGFQLSFFVVLCIILMMPAFNDFSHRLFKTDPMLPDDLRPRWQKIFRVPAKFALDILLVSLAAWLGSIPLLAYYFHIVTPVSAPANLLAVPACALVLAANFISLLLAGWLPAGAVIFNHAGWALMEFIRTSSHWFADWPSAYFYVPEPGLLTSAVYYTVLLGLVTGWIFKPKLRAGKIVCLAALSIVWFAQWKSDQLATRLTILPLSGGSAIYCDAPGGKDDLLVDCGNDSSVEFVMKPFLRGQGVNRMNQLLLTHGDLRRIGGEELIEKNFAPEKILTSGISFRSHEYRQIISRLEKAPDRWRKLNRGDSIGAWKVLHPDSNDHFPQADDSSLVLLGDISGVRVLLLSDLGRPGQSALLEHEPNLRADIVVAGLPEQNEPLSDALLNAIQPRLIILTDSEFPATKRASAQLRERLAQKNVPVIYTREAGGLKLIFRSGKWKLSASDGGSLSNETLEKQTAQKSRLDKPPD